MRIYEKVLRIPEYFIYDPSSGVLEGYRLGSQRGYERIPATAEGRVPSEQLGLLMGVEEGTFMRHHDRWLRWYTPTGQRLPTADEAKAEAESRARQMAEQLAEYARRFGPLPGAGG